MRELPQEFLKSLKALPGFDEEAFVHAHSHESRVTSIRLNPFKKAELDFSVGEAVPWCEGGFYLSERPSFTHDPLFHSGTYYVQEAGSMFLDHALRSAIDLSQKLNVLDLCAAPGGKSTLINSLLNSESLLVSNEIHRKRVDILAQNLGRWGTENAVVTSSDPENFSALNSFFDVIVVDAPCSGSGLFRKQPEAIDEWSCNLVGMCAQRQKKILESVLPALNGEGHLIYSTCSYSIEEDEQIVKWLLDTFELEYVPLKVRKEWNVTETDLGYRFYPHLTKAEGFFLAMLRKKGERKLVKKHSKKQNFLLKNQEADTFSGYFDQKSNNFIKINEFYHLVTPAAEEFVSRYSKQFYLKKAGVSLGQIKGNDLVPHQDLAWFRNVDDKMKVNLDRENCLKYLKKENLALDSAEKGFRLISYKNLGLGWAKILPGRMNNYLPSELRILN
jgi:16S rRNA C967 or C1407 C5-methylase (RsmB/RsmF family)/NOL1/NOP2/fmu family ribosome biogenesis protein